MNGNIIGEPFDPQLLNEIQTRQEVSQKYIPSTIGTLLKSSNSPRSVPKVSKKCLKKDPKKCPRKSPTKGSQKVSKKCLKVKWVK